MMMATSIDVSTTDQGLSQLLDARQVHAEVKKYIIEDCQITSTMDFLGYFKETTHEAEIQTLLESKFQVKEEGLTTELRGLYVARLRRAYSLALEVNKRIQAAAAEPPPQRDEDAIDMDKPMDPSSIEKLDSTWTDGHDLKLINYMRPAPQFRNRLFRETHMKNARMIQVEKVQTMEDIKMSSEPDKLEIGTSTMEGSKLVLESVRKVSRKVTDCLEYLTALRILMQAYAYVGSHKVMSMRDQNKQITFFPLEVAVGYVDETTMATLAMRTFTEKERLDWLRKRDEQVRGEMVAYINDGWPGGEALTRASERLAHIWMIREGAVASSGEAQEDRGQKRPRQDKGGKGNGKAAGKSQKGTQDMPRDRSDRSDTMQGVQRASQHKGVKFCGAFNGKKGCTWNEKDCPQHAKHMCNVIMPNGQICRRTNHGAHTHR